MQYIFKALNHQILHSDLNKNKNIKSEKEIGKQFSVSLFKIKLPK